MKKNTKSSYACMSFCLIAVQLIYGVMPYPIYDISRYHIRGISMQQRVIFLLLSILPIMIPEYVHAFSCEVSISSYGTFDYSSLTVYFPHSGEGDFEKFPFCKYSGYQDWDWANGYQMDAEGNLFSYSDCGNNPDVYIRQSTEHVQHGEYSAEFHLGEGTEPTHGSNNKHCKLFEANQKEYPDSYLHPTDGQPEAYYSAWFWFPSDFESMLSDWLLIMQWADREGGSHFWTEKSGATQSCFPTISLTFRGRNGALQLSNNNFYRYDTPEEQESKYTVWDTGYTALSIPKNQWVHIVALVIMSSGFRVLDGQVVVWINEEEVLNITNISLWNYWTEPKDTALCWGIGAYGDKLNTGSIWIDNVQVADGYIS